MPYLSPETTLERFGEFTINEIRSTIGDDDEFIYAQAGSMGSALKFTAREVGGMNKTVTQQRRAFLGSLEAIEDELDETEEREAIDEALTKAKTRIEETEQGDAYASEAALLSACNELLSLIESEIEPSRRNALRNPLYEFLESRVHSQLRMLGRTSDDN
jgi:arginine deiminase